MEELDKQLRSGRSNRVPLVEEYPRGDQQYLPYPNQNQQLKRFQAYLRGYLVRKKLMRMGQLQFMLQNQQIMAPEIDNNNENNNNNQSQSILDSNPQNPQEQPFDYIPLQNVQNNYNQLHDDSVRVGLFNRNNESYSHQSYNGAIYFTGSKKLVIGSNYHQKRYITLFDWDRQSDVSDPEDISQFDKRPIYTFEFGGSYAGQWKMQMRHGYGIQKWPDGSKYEGYWKNDKAHGHGSFYQQNGDLYQGRWKDNMVHGFGKYKNKDGAQYEGDWKFDMQHGFGKEIWTDHSVYEGHYYKGKKQGNGYYTWPDGSQFTGDWYDNKINGNGTYIWQDGRQYDGQWKDNMMDGFGIHIWKDGRRYEGQYKNDKKHGQGIYRWSDGKQYNGQWFNGKQHGRGKQIINWKSRDGIWVDGRRTQWLGDSVDIHI